MPHSSREGLKVAKFGGSSVCVADMIRTVRDIVLADTTRTAIVVSAPGARFEGDVKVTDLLERWAMNGGTSSDSLCLEVEHRFQTICADLTVGDFDLAARLAQMRTTVAATGSQSPDLLKTFAMSRGEWLNAQIVARVLRYEYIDAADFVSFDTNHRYDHERTKMRASAIGLRDRARNGIVVPGYYGSAPGGEIITFPRDGSDITGSILAALTDASVYENFTDINGFRAVSPKIIESGVQIEQMTYGEARELAFMGSPILQPHAVKYARDADIPIHVRKTDRELSEGTWIRSWIDAAADRPVTGIAVRMGGTIISIEKYGMDEEIGFLARTTKVFGEHGIAIHNCPGSVDTLSFIVLDAKAREKMATLSYDLELVSGADVHITPNISVICVVGRGMLHTRGVAAKITAALAHAGINIVMMNQGSSERNVEIGVTDDDAHAAVRAIYQAFFGE